MSMTANAIAGAAALHSAQARRHASGSQNRFALLKTGVEYAVQPEATSRHKGDCGR
jgi:hypothetical protein